MNRLRQIGLPLVVMVLALGLGVFAPMVMADPPPDIDTPAVGEPVVEEPADPQDERPDDLPSGVDSGQHDDEYEEGVIGSTGFAPAPSGLTVTRSDNDSVVLSWTAVPDATAYLIEYKKSSASSWLIHGYEYDSSSYSAHDLDCETAYDFKVRARGDGDIYSTTYGYASDSVSRTTSQCRAPAPTGFRVTSSDSENVTLGWTAVEDAARYRVEYKRPSSTDYLVDGYVNGTSHTVDNLTCNTTYEFRVAARGDGDPYSYTYGKASEVLTHTTAACPLVAPSSLSLSIEDNDADLDATFTAATGADYYEVKLFRSASQTGTFTQVADARTTASPAGFDYQQKGYWYKAQARSCSTTASPTCGDWGDSSTATQLSFPQSAPPAPTGLRVTSTREGEINLSWSLITDAYKYMVERSTSLNGPWVPAFYELSARTNYKAVGLECETTYYFRISVRGDGSPYSEVYGAPSIGPVSGKTKACTNPDLVGAPSAITVGTKTQSSINLTWPAVTNAAGYIAERGTSRKGPWGTVRFQSTSPARNDHVGLECGTTYFYRARAKGNGTTKSSVYGPSSPIKEVATLPCQPAVEVQGLVESIQEDGSDGFTIAVTGLSSSTTYTIRATTDSDLAFNSACTDRSEDTTASGSTSKNVKLRLYGCQVTGGEVVIKVLDGTTTKYETTVDVAVAGPSMLTFSDDTPVLGQTITVSASATNATGYKLQELSNSGWTTLLESETISNQNLSSYDPVTRTFRVIASYSTGATKTSAPASVEWETIGVLIERSNHFPESDGSDKDDVKLTAVVDREDTTGFTYRWLEEVGTSRRYLGGFVRSPSHTVTSTEPATKTYLVQVRPPSGSNASSQPVYVTWDEADTISNFVDALYNAVKADSTYGTTQDALLTCMNPPADSDGEGGASGSGGSHNATSTPPLPGGASGSTGSTSTDDPTFASFDEILMAYKGKVKDKMEDDCSAKADAMFSKVKSLAQAKITTTKAENDDYAALLDTPIGKRFTAKIGNPETLKLFASIRASNPQEPSDSNEGGAGGDSEDQTNIQRTGLDCLPYSGEAPEALKDRMAILNCLVFETPHSFWVGDGAQTLKARIDSDYTRQDGAAIKALKWLGRGDWICTPPAPQMPVTSCLKHDVAYGSLQKFEGRIMSDGYRVADGNELDEAWNPRNKSLADSKFYADILKHGCQLNSGELVIIAICLVDSATEFAEMFHWGVAVGNAKGWPVTDHDLKDAGGAKEEIDPEGTSYRFIDCDGPVPRVTNVSVSQATTMDRVTLTWANEHGCIDPITIKQINVCVRLSFGKPLSARFCKDGLGAGTTITTMQTTYWEGLIAEEATVEFDIVPNDINYGSGSYHHFMVHVPVRN